MYRIIEPRGSGKSTNLLLLAKKLNATLVCSNLQYMVNLAHEYGITEVNIVSYDDYLGHGYIFKDEKILIDEIDGLLEYLPGDCIGYSLSEGD